MVFRKKFYPSARQRSSCLGRVGAVVNDVLQTFNDDTQKQLNQNDIVRWFNMAQLVIAQKGYWKKSAYVNLVINQVVYDLGTLFTDYVDFRSCRYAAGSSTSAFNDKVIPIADWHTYKSLTASNETAERPYLFYLETDKIYFYPKPSVAVTNAMEILYDYCPVDLQCTTSYTFFTPKPYDGMYRDFALYNAYLTESDSVNVVGEESAPNTGSSYGQYKHGFYLNSFNKQMDRLFNNLNTPGMRLRGYR
jgi:hypothetical protein